MFTVYAKLNLAKYILQGNWYDTGIKIHSSFSSKEQLLCLDNITEMIYTSPIKISPEFRIYL